MAQLRLIVNDQLVTDKEAVMNTWATHLSDLSHLSLSVWILSFHPTRVPRLIMRTVSLIMTLLLKRYKEP